MEFNERNGFGKSIITCWFLIVFFTAACNNGSKVTGASEKFPLGEIALQGLSGGVCNAPAYIAKEQGFFEAEGLDVTLVSGSFETNKTGLASGRFAVATGDFKFFPSVHEGLDIKLIGGLHEGCIRLLVPPGSPIKNAKELAGKRIGVDEIGGSPMAITSVLLANNGIDAIKGVTWIPYPLDQLQAVADKGEVDAIAVWDPYGSIAEDAGYTLICDISTDPLFAGKYCCFLYASSKQLRENPERIKALLRAYQKASEWIAAHPQETARIIIDKGYVPASDALFVSKLIEGYKYHAKRCAGLGTRARNDAAFFVEELKKTGFLPTTLNTEEFVGNLHYDLWDELGDGTNEGQPSDSLQTVGASK